MEATKQLKCPACGEMTVTCSSWLAVESPVSTLTEWIMYFAHDCSRSICGFRQEDERCIGSVSDSTDPMTEWGYPHKDRPSWRDSEVSCPMCGTMHGA
jgi:hypothetical protein